MADFAKIDDNNTVIGTTVVSDADCNNGDEAAGVAFLTNLTGWSNWKKFDRDIQNYVQIGGTYIPEENDFRPVQPENATEWDNTKKIWKYPYDGDLEPTDPI